MMMCVACGNNANQGVREPNEVVCGGYSKEREPSQEEIAMLKSVIGEGDMVITPITVSTQVVAGLNYEFWCSYEDAAHNESGHCWIHIYKDLDGVAELTSLTKQQ